MTGRSVAASDVKTDLSEPSSAMSTAVILATVVVTGLLGIGATPDGAEAAQYVTSLSSLALGVWIFWRHGGPQISAVGVYSLATSAFIGAAGLILVREPSYGSRNELFLATWIAYSVHAVTYALCWRRNVPRTGLSPPPPTLAWPLVVVSSAACILGLITAPYGYPVRYVSDGASFAGILLLSYGLTGTRLRKATQLTMIALAFLSYLLFAFSGYGRLTAVAAALGPAIILAHRAESKVLKVGVLIAAVPAVYVLSVIRQFAAASRYGFSTTGAPDMTASIVAPLDTFVRLISSDLPPAGGRTLIPTLLFFVPRRIWPDKPVGFGTELTAVLEPEMLGTGHSMAALSLGEWFYNWHMVGLLISVPIVGLAVRLLDRILERHTAHRVGQRPEPSLFLVVHATLVAGLADYVWVGSFTYGSRTGFRLCAVVGLWVIAIAIGRALPAGTRTSPP